MSQNQPVVSNVSKDPKWRTFLTRVLHSQWRFPVAVGFVLVAVVLVVAKFTLPWKSSHISDKPLETGQVSVEGLVAGSPSKEENDSAEEANDLGDKPEQSPTEKTATNNSSNSGSGSGGTPSGGSSGGGQSSNGGSSSGGSGGCVPGSTGAGGYPLPNLNGRANACNTGPRYECTHTQGTLITSSHGQVIERVCINGSLEIRHNNVTVRDVTIMGTGTYALDIGQNTSPCPSNLHVSYTEVNMVNAGNMDWGIYQRCAGGHTFDHLKIHNLGRGMMVYGNLTMTNSYLYSHRTQTGAHRTALSTHGGDNFTVTGNTFICVNTGCSSGVNMYSDYAPVTNYLFQNNLVGGGSICLRGGETHNFPDDTHDIRILNNRFSTLYNPLCGQFQAIGQFDFDGPGNVASGNVYHESGAAIPGYY